MRKLLAILLLSIVLAAAAFLVIGPARLWAQFGPADLGEVDFATLARRTTPNDALACLPAYCAARADVPAPVFDRPFGDVFLAIQDAVVREPGLEQVGADAAAGTLRFVQRSRLMGFPDTINVKVVPVEGGGTAVLLYSRSQIGRSDMGVNLARVKRWIGLLAARLGAPAT